MNNCIGAMTEPCPWLRVHRHTWGRWRCSGDAVTVDGIPWDVPRNTRFNILDLPEVLSKVFRHGYLRMDLFCIPQDGSIRANIEISRQAMIFSNANAVIAWLDDNDKGWSQMMRAPRWLCIFYAENTINEEYVYPSIDELYKLLDCTDDSFTELMREDPGGPGEPTFIPLNSLLLCGRCKKRASGPI